jgi:hypothetical protein
MLSRDLILTVTDLFLNLNSEMPYKNLVLQIWQNKMLSFCSILLISTETAKLTFASSLKNWKDVALKI